MRTLNPSPISALLGFRISPADCHNPCRRSGIALKSGMCQAGADFNMPTVNVRIEHVSARSRSSCFVTGSEDEGGVHNVSVKDYVRRSRQGFAASGDD